MFPRQLPLAGFGVALVCVCVSAVDFTTQFGISCLFEQTHLEQINHSLRNVSSIHDRFARNSVTITTLKQFLMLHK